MISIFDKYIKKNNNGKVTMNKPFNAFVNIMDQDQWVLKSHNFVLYYFDKYLDLSIFLSSIVYHFGFTKNIIIMLGLLFLHLYSFLF